MKHENISIFIFVPGDLWKSRMEFACLLCWLYLLSPKTVRLCDSFVIFVMLYIDYNCIGRFLAAKSSDFTLDSNPEQWIQHYPTTLLPEDFPFHSYWRIFILFIANKFLIVTHSWSCSHVLRSSIPRTWGEPIEATIPATNQSSSGLG